MIEWKKDDKIIIDGEKFNIKNVDWSYLLFLIYCLDFDDSGKYFICVINVFGIMCDEIEINVEGM